MLTATDYRTIGRDLLAAMDNDRATLTLEDGRTITARIVPDTYHTLHDDGDYMGEIVAPHRDTGRPAQFDGAARKMRHRGGTLWWQPPADLKSDPERLEALARRVQDYYLERWGYVVAEITLTAAPCACCGQPQSTTRALGAIESDAGDYFVDIFADLLSDMED
jgi:hypothetical protein